MGALAGCLGDDGDGDGGGDIVIGNVAPFSGAVGSYGPYIQSGLEFAAQEINDDGGVLGRDIVIEDEDNESAGDPTATGVQRLAEDAVAITGPVLSSSVIRGAQEAEDLEIPLLPIQGSSPSILSRDSRYTFRVGAAAAPYYAGVTADIIEEEGIETYGAIYADYPYGQSYAAGVEEYIVGMEGLDTTIQSSPVAADDYGGQIQAMPDDLEYMDLGGHPTGIYTIIPQMWELGYEPALTSGPGDPFPNFWDALGEDITRGLLQVHSVDTTADDYVEVAERYAESEGEYFDPFTAFGYVVANHVAAAIREADEVDSVAVRDAISDMRYETILPYPLEYTEWGEFTEVRLTALEFSLDPPSWYPDGDFSTEVLTVSDPFEPLDPDEWE